MNHINHETLIWLFIHILIKGHLDCIITNVSGCLQRVLSLINDGRRGNYLVETMRGVKHKGMNFDFNLNTKYFEECNGINHGDIQNVIRDNADNEVKFTVEVILIKITYLVKMDVN